jgi:alpha-1,3/alpha-1,6-mannosyltransferase
MALCAYIRCILVAFKIAFDSRAQRYDVIMVDQVSAVVPFLKLLTTARILFYCHFPDLLLAQRRSSLHSMYRAPLDWIEQITTGQADSVLVNSKFTCRVFADTFVRLDRRGIVPEVLYPAVRIPSERELAEAASSWTTALPEGIVKLIQGGPTFLSINRFERKKNIELAVEALQQLTRTIKKQGKETAFSLPRLVIAGGYDPRLPENVEYLSELGRTAAGLGVREQIAFLPSFTDPQRAALLAACCAVLYTPQGEHFGIVPLEAMASERPVIACNSGGPLESVVDGKTGFLCRPRAEAFAIAMEQLLAKGVAETLGKQARVHVSFRFSLEAFGERLNETIVTLAGQNSAKKKV